MPIRYDPRAIKKCVSDLFSAIAQIANRTAISIRIAPIRFFGFFSSSRIIAILYTEIGRMI